jgi:plastocyanin
VLVNQNFAFSGLLTIPGGTTFTSLTRIDYAHVTADDGAFDAGRLSNGQEFTFTFEQAGTYAYHCNIHRSMTGTITVQ